MWRLATLPVVVALLMGMFTPVAPVQAQAPTEQAAQAGFPLLTEFTLKPGDQPFTFSYTAQADGPHRMIAAWGATVGLRLEVHGAGPDPISGQGNPVSVAFAAKQGIEYTIKIGPAGNLPITSVGELYGGLRKAQAMVVTTGELVLATPGPVTPGITPIPIPGPVLSGATPIPLPGPQSALKPLPPAVIAKLMAPVDWAATLKTAGGNPAMGQLLSSLPGGVAGTTQQVSDNVTRVRAPTVPESSAAIDWRAGLKFRFWSEPPAYYAKGKKCYVAAMHADYAELGSYVPLSSDQAKGILRLRAYPFGRVTVNLEVPAEPGTYAITIRTTDAQGTLRSTWAVGDEPIIRLTCVRPWMDAAHRAQNLPLTHTVGPTGFSTIVAVAPPDDFGEGAWAQAVGVRCVNLTLVLVYEDKNNSPGFMPPFLFGGMDIVRIN